jgi:hypothetical protein
VASKEIGLEVNADKTKHMVMSRDQNAGRSHSIKNDNSSFEGARCWWRSWLRHCSTSGKVAGLIPDGVIGIFN